MKALIVKLISLLIVACMLVPIFASCDSDGGSSEKTETTEGSVTKPNDKEDDDNSDEKGNNNLSGNNSSNNTSGEHEHAYDKQNISPKYLKSAATCTEKSTYYYSCSCGEKGTAVFEEGNALGHKYNNDCDKTCNECGQTRTVLGHTYTNSCDTSCNECGATRSITHTYDNACDTSCNVCGQTRTASGHTYTNSCDTSCNECGATRSITHTYDNDCDATCNICGNTRTVIHKFEQKIAADKYFKAAATATDSTEYYYSCKCGEKGTTSFFADVAVKFYKNGTLYTTLTATKANGYKLTFPTFNDITENPDATFYVQCWYSDSACQTKCDKDTVFTQECSLYSKQHTITPSKYQYTVNAGKATITGYIDSTATTLIIPKYINTFPITAIGASAFSGKTMLRNVIICEGVETISAQAFSGCNSIQYLDLPQSITSIGESAFKDCVYLPQELNIPSKVTSIGYGAFSGCSNIKSITIPNSMQSIGDGAFTGCSGLISITISDTVKSIGSYAFSGCSLLTSITIPDNVTSIGYGAFSGCSSIKQINIPSKMESIGNGAFFGCDGLTSITIPSSVKSIAGYAFANCSSLKEIIIPNSVTSIGEGAFSGCTSLEKMTLPFVGGSIKELSDAYQYPFGYIFGTSAYTGGVATKQQYYGESTSSTPTTQYYIPNTLKFVTITGGNILRGAFMNCSGLTNITLPQSITSIESDAFYMCTSLKAVNIGDNSNITRIATYAFYYCTSLETITISASVTSVGDSAFYGCSSLKSVTFGDNSKLKNIYGYAFSSCTNLKIVSFGKNSMLEYIRERAFSNCTSLESIIIPPSVTNIHEGAFYNCTGLTSITISEGVKNIGNSAFYNCLGLTEINFNATAVYDLSSGNDVFYNAGHNGNGITVTVGANVTKMPAYLFMGTPTVPINIISVVFAENSQCKSIGRYAFYCCKKLTSIIIPSSVTSIYDAAFTGCDSLSSVTFEDTATWYYRDSRSSYMIDVTNATTNATYIRQTYAYYDWEKR